MKTCLGVVLVTLLLIASGCTRYTEYIPVELTVVKGEHVLAENPGLLTPRHVNAMAQVLEEYGKPHRLRNGKLYIEQSLQSDRDLLQNFTAKARAMEMGADPAK